MDPLDPEFYKFNIRGPPIQCENVLIDLKLNESLKTPLIIGGTILAGIAGYFWFTTKKKDDDSSDDDGDDFGYTENFGENQIVLNRTTTTTTTTTTISSLNHNSHNNNSSHPLHNFPPPIYPNPNNITNNNSSSNITTPLTPEDQNRVLIENIELRNVIDKDFKINNEMKEKFYELESNNRELKLELERERLCNICLDLEKTVCWKSCGHRLCRRCAVLIKKSNRPHCPFCSKKVDDFISSFNS